MPKIIRVTTVPGSLGGLLKGQLKHMSQFFEIIGIASPKDKITSTTGLDDVARNEEIEVIPVRMTRKITPVKDVQAVWQLYKVFKREKPDIVHSHTPKAGTLSMIAAKMARVPHRLHTVAGLPLLVATGKKRKLLDAVEKLTYSCATKVYPNSYGLKEIIKENKFTKDKKLKVIGKGSSNGIDTSHFNQELISDAEKKQLMDQYGISQEDFVFIFVGRIVKDKGIHELIEAFKRISKQKNNIKLLLVGTFENELDPVKPETKEEIDTNENIIFTGWQKDVRPFFAIADVLTFPSYREGFPNVVMQAGALGLFSIVTDINGCNEIVQDGDNGIIIPVRNTEKLYEAMLYVLDHKDEIKSNTDKYRNKIVSSYERQYIWDELLKEYKLLLEKN